MPNVSLQVAGNRYSGWKRIKVTRGIEAICGAFELEVSDRWNDDDLWPIAEEDECVLWIDGVSVVSGYVDRRSISFSATTHSLTVSGRDKASALVDCSAVLKSWEFASLPLLSLATKLAEPFGITVTMDTGVDPKAITLRVGKHGGSVTAAGHAGKEGGLAVPKPLSKFTVDPGESAFEVLERACRLAGVLPVSDGFGGILLTRAGTQRTVTALGDNVLAGSAEYDSTGRYRRYIVSAQHPGSDEFFGEAVATVRGEATDPKVRRASRVLMVRTDGSAVSENAKVRAAWEANIRAARGDSVSVTVQGWTQEDGNLWPVNALVPVDLPFLGVLGDMLITQAVHSVDDSSGFLTQLSLKRPDAFAPEPTVSPAGGFWKEIAGGV